MYIRDIVISIITIFTVNFIFFGSKFAYSGGYPFSISGDIRSVPS